MYTSRDWGAIPPVYLTDRIEKVKQKTAEMENPVAYTMHICATHTVAYI